MARRFKDMQTPEQQYQAQREQAWRADNAEALTTRADLHAVYGVTRTELDRLLPLTSKPEPVTPDAPAKSRRWFR